MKNIIVFGATGDTGRYFMNYFKENYDGREYEIVAVGRRNKPLEWKEDIQYVKVDITNKNDFLKLPNNVYAVVVYYPNLLRKLKDSFNDNKYENILNEILTCDILLLDDLGAEANSSWSRDEILGNILQTRMDNNLSTFITSNFTLDELENHLTTTKDSTDKVKARRIIERIKQLTNQIELVSENRRG